MNEKEKLIYDIVRIKGIASLNDITSNLDEMKSENTKYFELFTGCNVPIIIRAMVKKEYLLEITPSSPFGIIKWKIQSLRKEG